jgi:fructose/tagatose bisphosphate aldolase
MPNQYYRDVQSTQEIEDLVKQVCVVEGGSVISISDAARLQNEIIYTLQFNASVSENQKVKQAAMQWIQQVANAMHITSGSNHDFYKEKASGKYQFFTVPAINARMVTFHKVRAALRVAKKMHLPHIIFELALSEAGYTGQQKDEYAALVKAAYISLGMTKSVVYLQADHYQLDPKKYEADTEAEMQRIKDAIVKAIENGVYNIDIDTSKFETADADKTDRENQGKNAYLTAELLHFIRQYEAEHDLPHTLSIGGEVGEVGGENTKYPQVNVYLEMLAEHLQSLGSSSVAGLDKVSINVGSAHGGVLGPDGQPLDSVPIDFTAHHDLYMLGQDSLHAGHVLPVQHGASTLPKKYFSLFPAMHVAEVHLATGYQNIVWEVLEKEDTALYKKMKDLTFEKFNEKIDKHKTEAIGFMKERKRVTEFVKRDLLLSDALDKIEEALEQEFTTIFYSLYSIFEQKTGHVEEGDRDD